MKIIVDAMGGDNAPLEIVQGALAAARARPGLEIVLVGREAEVRAAAGPGLPSGVSVVNATEVIDMHDDPARAFRNKPDSSITVGLTMLRDGQGDAFVSAGSTGALFSAGTLIVKRIRGIRRAAMAPLVPTAGRWTAGPPPTVRWSTCSSSPIWAASTPPGPSAWTIPGWPC